MARFASDHYPILLDLSASFNRRNIPFYFEKIWLLADGFHDAVHNAWKCVGNHSPGIKLSMLLANTRRAIMKWRGTVENLFVKGQQLYDHISHLQLLESQQNGLSD